MIKRKKHLKQDNRYVIQDMLYDGNSATQIAQNIGVHTSTITREIKNNRLVKIQIEPTFCLLAYASIKTSVIAKDLYANVA